MSNSAKRVVVLCFDGMELLDVAGPANVLTAAARLAPGIANYDVQLAAVKRGPVRTGGGLELCAGHTLRGLRPPIDTLMVPGGFASGQEVMPTLRRLAGQVRRVVGICTGALLLADAGLLVGRRAVTHWRACDELQRRAPDCDVDPDPIFVHDGMVWTSAGVTAGMDLALALVEQDHDAELALSVARWLVMYLRRPGGQSQFSAPLAAQAAQRGPIRKLVDWIPDHLRADLSVPALAQRASMSPRNFARVFADETGMTPAAWVQRVRLEAARSLLERTGPTVKEIAARAGFTSVETMHRAFRRELGSTPQQYRTRFRV